MLINCCYIATQLDVDRVGNSLHCIGKILSVRRGPTSCEALFTEPGRKPEIRVCSEWDPIRAFNLHKKYKSHPVLNSALPDLFGTPSSWLVQALSLFKTPSRIVRASCLFKTLHFGLFGPQACSRLLFVGLFGPQGILDTE